MVLEQLSTPIPENKLRHRLNLFKKLTEDYS
jgi:hypothetical protein